MPLDDCKQKNPIVKNHNLVASESIEYIDTKFNISSTVGHLYNLMSQVTEKEISPESVNAACNCVNRMNETIDTVIRAAKFLNDK